jgi:hypothetical protein
MNTPPSSLGALPVNQVKNAVIRSRFGIGPTIIV